MKPVKVGIVGCGNICNTYMQAGNTFDILEIAACSDIIMDRAVAKAKEWNIPHAYTLDEMLADPEISIIINLTVPKAHAEIAFAAVEAGKNIHNEKPLTIDRNDAKKLLKLADEKGVRVGCAPDTFLGAGLQTCRKLIDDGVIGEPIGASAFFTGHGPESWHPDPEFFYKPGAGPMFDMGPYYLTALINLISPVKSVLGSTRITFPERIIGSEPHKGEKITVETPTHITGIMEFENGAIGTILTSFDVWAAELPRIEIYGTKGTMSVPDPNCFGGPVKIFTEAEPVWKEYPLTHGYAEQSRGIGAADMAYAIQSGRPHRANGNLAYHVLDLMHSFHDASNMGKRIEMEKVCSRPKPLPVGLEHGKLDE